MLSVMISFDFEAAPGSVSERFGEITTKWRWHASCFLCLPFQLQVRSASWFDMKSGLSVNRIQHIYISSTLILKGSYLTCAVMVVHLLWYCICFPTACFTSTTKFGDIEACGSLLQSWGQAHCVHREGSFGCKCKPLCQELLPGPGMQEVIEKCFQYCAGRGSSNSSGGIWQWF